MKDAKLEAIHSELFDIANSYAGDKTGNVAVALHVAASLINIAKQELANKGSKEMSIIHMAGALSRIS